jgi:flagellar protein FlgJ
MNPNEFVKKYYPYALECEKETSIPAIAIMAQAALESGWGKKAIGNNLFGIKFRKGDYEFRKVLTTECSARHDQFKGKDVKSKVYLEDVNKYRYKVWQYFADYETPKECFKAHSKLLLTDRYKHCLRWKHSPKRFLIAVWRSGYATALNYGKTMCNMVDSVNRRI